MPRAAAASFIPSWPKEISALFASGHSAPEIFVARSFGPGRKAAKVIFAQDAGENAHSPDLAATTPWAVIATP